MSMRYAAGKKAQGLCDVCGQQYLLRKLKETTVKGVRSGIKSCPTCWDPDHPQLMVGVYPVYDPQALRDPRSDSSELEQVRDVTLAPLPQT